MELARRRARGNFVDFGTETGGRNSFFGEIGVDA